MAAVEAHKAQTLQRRLQPTNKQDFDLLLQGLQSKSEREKWVFEVELGECRIFWLAAATACVFWSFPLAWLLTP